jgi:hypothetical protein
VEFDKISFPADQTPLKSKPYNDVAVLFLNFLRLRTKYQTVWDELISAWASTFGKQLTNETLGSPPSQEPHAFASAEREWCEQTLRFVNGGSLSQAQRRLPGAHPREMPVQLPVQPLPMVARASPLPQCEWPKRQTTKGKYYSP